MYKILRSDGAVLYDVNDPDLRLLTEAKGTFEIGQPGSLQFAMVPAHPYYDEVEVMATYVTALRENVEIFYGRIIDINIDKTTGVKQIECAGALQFLDDGELAPITGSDGKGLDLTASEFLTRCITAHNAEINNDPLRVLSVGTVSHAKASMSKKYNLTGYSQVKSALDSNLITEYGGYFRIRKNGNNHVLDWLDTYSEPNTSPIRLRENIQNQENTISAGDFFTMIRPSGKNNLVLEPIPISNALVAKYGQIIKSVNFKDEETEAGLRSAVADYIAEMEKGLGKSCTVRVIDMHFLDGSVPSIRLGSTYTNIAGFEGEPMVVAGMELNFTNPADDSVTLRNAKDLAAGTNGSVSSKGSVVQDMAKDRKGFQNIWQHITEGEDWLRLFADRIEINAQNLVELVGTFERYAEETTETIQFQGQDISVIKGTGVLQNTDQITQVAGMFSSKYYIVPVGSRPGRNPNQAGWYEAQQYLVKESDVNSGIELYASPAAAMNGRAINTTSQLASLVGQYVTRMVRTADTTPVDGKTYYSKTLGVMDGTSFTISDEGQETNVGKLLKETYEGTTANGTQIQLIEGSALWEHRDHITGVCGEYEVRTDQQTGEKTLVIVSGGGIKIRRDDTEFGLYDSDNLTAGVIVGKINNPTEPNPEKIAGTMVDITAQQVRIGTTSTVDAWMTSTGRDINSLQGLVADKATIADLEALDAKFSNVNARIIEAGQITPVSISSSGPIISGGGLYATNGLYVGGVNCTNLPTIGVTGVQVVEDGEDRYKLQYQTFSSGWTDAGSFNRAATPTTGWSGSYETGQTYTVMSGSTQIDTFTLSGTSVVGRPSNPDVVLFTVTADGSVRLQKEQSLAEYKQAIINSATPTTGWSGSYETGQTYTVMSGSTQIDTFTLSGTSVVGRPSNPDVVLFTVTADGSVRLQKEQSLAEYKQAIINSVPQRSVGSYATGVVTANTTNKQLSFSITPTYTDGTTGSASTIMVTDPPTSGLYKAGHDAGVIAGEGHFAKAAITLQGAPETIYPINNTGTIRYTSYSKLYKGDGGSYYGRGNAVSAYVKVGNRYDPKTLYAGDGILHYDRGHEVTSALVPDSSGSVYKYGAAAAITRYAAGTSYTATDSPYYEKTT